MKFNKEDGEVVEYVLKKYARLAGFYEDQYLKKVLEDSYISIRDVRKAQKVLEKYEGADSHVLEEEMKKTKLYKKLVRLRDRMDYYMYNYCYSRERAYEKALDDLMLRRKIKNWLGRNKKELIAFGVTSYVIKELMEMPPSPLVSISGLLAFMVWSFSLISLIYDTLEEREPINECIMDSDYFTSHLTGLHTYG